ncbi:MAG: hypothetical protein WCF84_00270 [Anaerolineae bacterium]
MTKQTVRQRKSRPAPRRDMTPLLIAGGVVAVLLVALVVSISVMQPSPSAPTPSAVAGRTWGKTTAKATIDVWSDFQ